MKVKAIAEFYDIQEHVDRHQGDVFEVAAKRFEEINSAGFGDLVCKVEEKPARQAKESE